MAISKCKFEEIMKDVQIRCKNDKELQNAISNFLTKNDLVLPDGFSYGFGIDFTTVKVDGFTVLIIGQPPTSNYRVRETEHTHKYLLPRLKAAV